MKKVLMITYCYPPMEIVGIFRTVKFVKYLREFGWDPVVLTVTDPPMSLMNPDVLRGVPEDIKVYRASTFEPLRSWENRQYKKKMEREAARAKEAPAVDESKLSTYVPPAESEQAIPKPPSGSIKKLKRFVQELLSSPDKEAGWFFAALPKAISICRKERIDCIYTSTPPHSAHGIGYWTKKITGLPFVADFRAPWTQNEYFLEEKRFEFTRNLEERMELAIHKTADAVLSNSVWEGEGYRRKYAERVGEKFFPILNGYDPADFEPENAYDHEKFTIVYVGGLYGRRNPDLFFEGVNRFLKAKPEAREKFKLLFVGRDVSRAMKDVGLHDLIEFTGHLPQKEAFRHLFKANMLLMILGFDPRGVGVIPAKLSEYLPTGRPILALIPEGETAGYVRKYSEGAVITEPDADKVAEAIAVHYAEYEKHGNSGIEAKVAEIEPFMRRYQTKQLAEILDRVTAK